MKSRDNLLLLVFLGFFFSTVLVFSPKTFLLLFLIVSCILFFVLKIKLLDSVFLTYLLSLPFENPLRDWIFYNTSSDVPSGFTFHFTYAPKLILGALLFLILILPRYRSFLKTCPKNKTSTYLILFTILAVIGSLIFHAPDTLITLGLIRLLLAIGTFFVATTFFSQKENKKIFKLYILSLVIFCVAFGALQLIKQKPLGRFIELTPDFFQDTGYVTTDGQEQYRVTGFISHPVYFGSLLSMLIPLFMGILWKKQKKIKKNFRFIIPGFTLLSFAVLIGVLSRSTWINILLILTGFYFYNKAHPIKLPQIKFTPKQIIIVAIVLLCVSIPIVNLFFERIQSVKYIFQETGSGATRVQLIKQSFLMLRDEPVFGVGLNKFTHELIENGISPGIAAPVHNTILLFASELGIPAAIFFILFLWSLLKPKIKPTSYSSTQFACWIAALTFLVSSQFHPLFNLDPTFDIFMLILGYLSSCQTQKS